MCVASPFPESLKCVVCHLNSERQNQQETIFVVLGVTLGIPTHPAASEVFRVLMDSFLFLLRANYPGPHAVPFHIMGGFSSSDELLAIFEQARLAHLFGEVLTNFTMIGQDLSMLDPPLVSALEYSSRVHEVEQAVLHSGIPYLVYPSISELFSSFKTQSHLHTELDFPTAHPLGEVLGNLLGCLFFVDAVYRQDVDLDRLGFLNLRNPVYPMFLQLTYYVHASEHSQIYLIFIASLLFSLAYPIINVFLFAPTGYLILGAEGDPFPSRPQSPPNLSKLLFTVLSLSILSHLTTTGPIIITLTLLLTLYIYGNNALVVIFISFATGTLLPLTYFSRGH